MRAEAVERDTRDPKDVSGRPPPQIGRERNRDVGRERGVAAVAEIEDAGELALLVQQQVVEVEVAVDDLGAQPGPFGQRALLETVERPRDERAAFRALDRGPRTPVRGAPHPGPRWPLVRQGGPEGG